MLVLVAGATGAVGTELVRELMARHHRVRGLSRHACNIADEAVQADATTTDLTGVCRGVDVVISALGASVSPNAPEKRSYDAVDYVGNSRLLAEAKQAGVKRFIYVSVHVEDGYRNTGYIAAHERFVEELRSSGISYTVIRPTGIFSAFAEILDFARKGPVPVLGDGQAKSNPVHEADVALAAINALESGPAAISIGGPDVLTRRQIAEEVVRALGKKPRILSMPVGVFGLLTKLMSIGSPRKKELFDFVKAVAVTDSVAPALGRQRLADYLRRKA
ncbi:MAG: SDR family oxidoreductase [Acidobacteria bacterium]|nr:SDR family oxidoreductase [Acidobacteriota bacterium]